MKAYILSVCGAVIVSSLVAILLPEGRTGKFINGILKLFCLLVMLIPLFSFMRGFEFSGSGESASEIELDDAFMDSFYNVRAEQEEAMLRSRLEEEYSLTLSVQIEWDIVEYEYKISKVKIEIENFGMYGNDEHILIINELKGRTSEILYIPAEEVEVYER